MPFPIIPVLTVIANAVAPAVARAIKKSPHAKANGAAAGSVVTVGGGVAAYELIDVALGAFLGGAVPQVEQGIAMLGGLAASAAINWIVAYASPRNDDG